MKKYTYFFFNAATGLTKIGRSTSPASRFVTLSSGRDLSAICVFSGDSEKYHHNQFSDTRVMGEWFRLPESIIVQLRADKRNLLKESIGGINFPGPLYSSKFRTLIEVDPKIHARLNKGARRLKTTTKKLATALLSEALDQLEDGSMSFVEVVHVTISKDPAAKKSAKRR